MHVIVERVKPPVLVVHGGAGSWKRVFDDPDYPYTLSDIGKLIRLSLEEGYRELKANGAVRGVISAVKVLEDSGMLNAGLGSALNLLGEAEMDAGIMASNGLIGAVGAVKYPRNPIELAYIVAKETDHIVLVGNGADMLAKSHGLPERTHPPDHVVKRYNRLMSELRQGKTTTLRWKRIRELALRYGLLGDTVGAVALDTNNTLASASSTGGIWLKHPGRLGDTPIPGAGFYANNKAAATATGFGEVIVKSMASKTLVDLVSQGLSLEEACKKTIIKAEEIGGKRVIGIIAVTVEGEICLAYDTEGMPSGYIHEGGVKVIEI